jgi:branched-chain amino acid transport system permease protein
LLPQQLVNAVTLGSMYAVIALGYTLVYGVLKLINFAHGDVFMVGAFVGLYAISSTHLHLPFALGVLLAMGVCSLLGVAIERCAYRPLREAPRLAALITAIGMSLLLENSGQVAFGAQFRSYPALFPREPIGWIAQRLGVQVTPSQMLLIAVSAGLMIGLHLVVQRTRFGRAIRAVSFDLRTSQLMGIRTDRIIVLTFALGSALAGAGGVLYGAYYGSIDPTMGIMPGIKAFVAAVLGGIGSVPGAMFGGLIMGLAEVGVIQFVGSQYRDAVAFAVLIVILLVKPTGIFARYQAERG